MSGIIAIAESEISFNSLEFNKTLDKFCIADLTIKDTYNFKGIHIGLLSTSNSEGSSAYDKKNGIYIVVDGYFVDNLGTKTSSAEWFLSNYLSQDISFINNLNGSFNIAIVNEKVNKLDLINDRYGTRPLFKYTSKNTMAISPFAALINDLGIVKKELNTSMLANQLSYSRVWLGNSTFFKGINSVESSTKIEWSEAYGYSEERVHHTNTISRIMNFQPVDLAEIFKNVMSDFNKLPAVGIALSGGLDSRLMLASGFKGPAFTWGYDKNNDEIQLAKRAAIANGNSWDFIKVLPKNFLDTNNVGDIIREGLDIFVQSYTLGTYPIAKASGVNGMITGLALDFTLGKSYSMDDSLDMNNKANVFDFINKKSLYFSKSEQEDLIYDNSLHEDINSLSEFIRNQIDNTPKNDYQNFLNDFFQKYRIRRCIFHRQQWQRVFLEDYIPTFDNRMIDGIQNFTDKAISGNKLLSKVLDILNTDLMKIPYQRTMLPVNTPVKFWKNAAMIEQKKEDLYRQIFADTNGDVFIPYNRYYSNFDEWLRVDKDWISYCDSLLLSENSIISNYCDQNTIRKWIDSQRQGKEAYFSKIIQLMSLEKTLRNHFE